MATHLGKEGVLNAATLTVAQVRGYSLNETAAQVDSTVMGLDWTTSKSTLKSWSVSGELFWDDSDGGQGSLTVGSTVTLALYPYGMASSSEYRQGSANVEAFDITARHDGMVEASFSAKGTGALSTLTV